MRAEAPGARCAAPGCALTLSLALALVAGPAAALQPASAPAGASAEVAAPAPDAAGRTLALRATAGGELRIEQRDALRLGHRFALTLAGRLLLSTDADDPAGEFSDFPLPKIVWDSGARRWHGRQLIVVQQFAWGNACAGGPLWVLAVAADGQAERSAPIDFCGGPPATVRADRRGIVVSTGPGEAWRHDGRTLRPAAPTAAR